MSPSPMTPKSTKSSDAPKLSIAVFGDVHCGHPNTPTRHILKNLRHEFPDNETTGQLDIIFIEGDFFDRQLSLPDDNVFEIRVWINSFLRMCAKRDIVVRVLEGTPSHDWKQPRLFTHVNEIAEIGADVKYIPNLSIEYIERFGIHVLYVPDEWRVTTDETWLEVQQLLAQHGLEQVDFAVMHGSFPHQLPLQVHGKVPIHDPIRYQQIVKKLIFVGHIHLMSQWDRILAAGSFDRTAHGEEGPKGHLRVRFYEDHVEIDFVENKNAQKYITIQCAGIPLENLHEMVHEGVKELPAGSFVRLKAAKLDPAFASLDFFKEKYPQFTWSVKEVGSGNVEDKPVLVDNRKQHNVVRITKDNIVKLLMDRVRASNPQLAERCEQRLNEVVHESR